MCKHVRLQTCIYLLIILLKLIIDNNFIYSVSHEAFFALFYNDLLKEYFGILGIMLICFFVFYVSLARKPERVKQLRPAWFCFKLTGC